MRNKFFRSELKTLFILIVFIWIIAFSPLAIYSCMLINKLTSENTESSAMYHLRDIDCTLFNNIKDIEVFTELVNVNQQKLK